MQISRIFLLLSSYLNLISGSSGVCQLLSRDSKTKYVNPCSSIVNYNFFIPNMYVAAATALGITPQEFLLQQVKSKLNIASLKSLTPSCQETIKSLTCVSIYPKCYLNQTYTGNQQILNYQPYSVDSNYSYGIQVYRPCASLCTNMPLICPGIYALTNKFPNCSARMDYSYSAAPASKAPKQFDKSNDPSVCFIPKSVPVAANKEKYLNPVTGVCAGLVDNVFVPAGTSIDASFAVLQEPFVVQTMTEAAAVVSWKKIPKWLSPPCLSAARQYICSQAFLFPQEKTFPTVLSENNVPAFVQGAVAAANPALYSTVFTFPSFYNATVCSNFRHQCIGFLSLAKSKANCTRITASSGMILKYFPTERQVLSLIPFTAPPFLKIYSGVQSYPVVDPMSSSSYVTCPATFVIPQNPEDPNVAYAPPGANSSCAISCRSPALDDDKWSTLVLSAFVVPLVGLILSSLMILSLVHTHLIYWKEKRSQGISKFTYADIQALLLLVYALLSAIVSAYSVALNSKGRDERFCADNAVPLSLEIGESMCTTQAGINTYIFIACSITFLIMALLRLVSRWQLYAAGTKGEYSDSMAYGIAGLSLAIILLGPVRPLTYANTNKMFGFTRSNAICGVLMRSTFEDVDSMLALDIPMLLTSCLWLLFSLLDLGIPLWLWLTKKCRKTHDSRVYLVVSSSTHGKAQDASVPAVAAQTSDDGSRAFSKQTELEMATISGKPSNVQEPKPQQKPNVVPGRPGVSAGYDAMLYFLPIFVIYLIFAINRASYYSFYDQSYNSLVEWIKCVFANSSTWDSSCGSNPENAPSIPILITFQLVLTAHSIIVAPCYFLCTYVISSCLNGGDGYKKPSDQGNNNNNIQDMNSNNGNNRDGAIRPEREGVVPPAAVVEHVQDIENVE